MVARTKPIGTVNPHKWTTQGGHWRPDTRLTSTQVVVINESRKRLGMVDTTPPKPTKHHVSEGVRHLRPKRERGLRGLVRRWMGWH